LGVEHFDLLAKLKEMGVFLLSTSGVLVFSVVGELVDLQTVVLVLGNLSLFLEALDLTGADLKTIGGHTGGCLCGCGLALGRCASSCCC
jgi:hypothetical protein